MDSLEPGCRPPSQTSHSSSRWPYIIFILGPIAGGGGWYLYDTRSGAGNAKLVKLERGGSSNAIIVNAVATIRFDKYPSTDRAKQMDLVLRFTQGRKETKRSWKWIAKHDDCEQTVPDEPPPLNIRCKVRVAVPIAMAVATSDRSRINLHVLLEWGGARQDRVDLPIGSRYTVSGEE